MKISIFSFFSGSGFLDLGFEMNNFTVDYVNEFSESFLKAYKYSRKQLGIPEPKFGYSKDINECLAKDAKKLRAAIKADKNDGNLVGFIGGPPCPDFSVAGKQKGREGDNGKLSQSYIDLIYRQRPDFFVFENVKGLWKTAKHRAYYEDLKSKISQYYILTDRLCNAIEFGAPQDRDRIILFGVRKSVVKQYNLNINNFDWDKYRVYDTSKLKSAEWPITSSFQQGTETKCPDGVTEQLTVEYWFRKNHVNIHPNNKDYFQPQAGLARMQTIQEGDVSKKSYKRLHRWRYSPTACYGNNEVHLHPYEERRISAAEALAIQTLPEAFCLPPDMTLTDKFKTIGNGVPYVLAEGIAKTIYDFFNQIR